MLCLRGFCRFYVFYYYFSLYGLGLGCLGMLGFGGFVVGMGLDCAFIGFGFIDCSFWCDLVDCGDCAA